jgi:hypothetical protein
MRSEFGDELFEIRVSAQWFPEGMKPEAPIVGIARH